MLLLDFVPQQTPTPDSKADRCMLVSLPMAIACAFDFAPTGH